jgi:translation initiation factor 2-alpha kinase 4
LLTHRAVTDNTILKMPPPNAWTIPRVPPARGSETSFPGLNPAAAGKLAPKSEYEEIQEDELLVLASMYGEDFKRLDTTNSGAWKVRS